MPHDYIFKEIWTNKRENTPHIKYKMTDRYLGPLKHCDCEKSEPDVLNDFVV